MSERLDTIIGTGLSMYQQGSNILDLKGFLASCDLNAESVEWVLTIILEDGSDNNPKDENADNSKIWSDAVDTLDAFYAKISERGGNLHPTETRDDPANREPGCLSEQI